MSATSPYIARFRISRPMLAVSAAFLALAVLGLATVDQVWPWELITVIGFTVPVVVLAIFGTAMLLRKQGLRVDRQGIFFGGRPPIYRLWSASVPWAGIREIYLFRVRTGLANLTYVGLRGDGEKALLGSTLPKMVTKMIWYVPAEAVLASRPAYGWSLDTEAFKAAVAHFAPHVEVVDMTAMFQQQPKGVTE